MSDNTLKYGPISGALQRVEPMSDEEYHTWKWWDEEQKCWVIKLRLTEQDWEDYNKWKKELENETR